ncbi:hypothetical protein [Streptomyces sp. STCH 565 A]|nr:hypothetical protein [Streptomyces sp. STCH 565 A]MCM8549178.1 hypothetical protein [Streptomyces sp. STCH 565 A]
MDEMYLTRVPATSARIGQRLVLSDTLCRQALHEAKVLCEALVNVLR